MSARRCCREATKWLAPSLVLALIPKCPMCVAAYVAAITGAGISIPMASRLRLGLLILCIAALAFLAAQTCARLLKSRRSHAGGPTVSDSLHPPIRCCAFASEGETMSTVT